jgi:hypothetical protein
MGFGDIDRRKRNKRGDPLPRKVKRVIEFDEAVFLAAEETVKRLQVSGEMTLDTFIQQAVQRDLKRRGVTWWEARVSKAMRLLSGA